MPPVDPDDARPDDVTVEIHRLPDAPGAEGPPRLVLGPGDEVSFGRDGATTGLEHVGLGPDERLHGHAGTISVDERGWVVVNTGRWLHLAVVDEATAASNDLAPGRALRVPYASARVEVHTGTEVLAMAVRCDAGELAPDTRPLAAGSTIRPLDLDAGAGYFRALVALCAPRLRDPAGREVATVPEIVRELNASGREGSRVSAKAVERRLAHVRRKVGIGQTAPDGSSRGLEVRDASVQLVELVLRTGTVRVEHLELIEAPR